MIGTSTATYGVHAHWPDADTDSDVDEEGEAREGGDLGEDEELIGRGGADTVDAAGGRCMGGAEGQGGVPDIERPPRQPSPRPMLISH